MKLFLKEILIYSFLMFAFAFVSSCILYHGFHTDFHGNYETSFVVNKLKHFTDDKNTYETVFVGTSKTLRQIDPIQFSKETGINQDVYNFGVGGLFPFRLTDVINKVSKKEGLKNIFIEIAPLDRIGRNYNSNGNINSMNLKRYFLTLSYIKQNKLNQTTKLSYFIYHTRALFYKYLGFGGSKQLGLIFNVFDQPEIENNRQVDLSIPSNGFIPYIEGGGLWNSTIKDHERLIKNPQKMEGLIKVYKRTKLSLKSTHDKYTDSLVTLANALSKKGMKVYFVLPPRQMEYGLNAVLNLRDRFRENGFIVFDCSDPEKFPTLYELENSYDLSHLNENGAAIFTSELAKLYLNQIN